MTKKILFNDRYGLTEAVLSGKKTQTRRMINVPRTFKGVYVSGFRLARNQLGDYYSYLIDENEFEIEGSYLKPQYGVGEIVAIAQSYKEIDDKEDYNSIYSGCPLANSFCNSAGWKNKMFTRSNVMPHQIEITGVRIERLQDISDEDCIKEGVEFMRTQCKSLIYGFKDFLKDVWLWRKTPKEAYQLLISRISSRKMWDENPFVFVYEFKLVK